MLALDETCRERLHTANVDHDTAVRNADTEKQRKQEQITIRLSKDTAKYRKQLAKEPAKLAKMLTYMAAEETKAKSRQEIPYGQSCAAATAILRQDTNDVETFRTRRQAELRAELKTRLVRMAVTTRLKESIRARTAQEQATKKAQRQQEWQALKDHHSSVIARLYATLPNLKPPFNNATRFPLQEVYHSRPTTLAAEPTKKVGPLVVSPDEFTVLTSLQNTPVDNTAPRNLYTDGSLIHSGTEEVAMAFSVVDLQQDIHLPIKGRTDGHASSAKAELMGLIAAVVAAPDGQDIVVRLDNESVVDQYQNMVQDRENTLPRKRFRSNYAGLWAVLSHVVNKRQGRVEVKWIRGHNNDPGNELADRTAKEAVHGDTTPWVVDLTQQEDIRTFAFCHGALVETDLRQLLKQQTTIRHHQHWTSQRRVKKAIPHLDDVEWRSTLAFVHARRAVFTFYSNSQDTRQRSHHIKKVHGMLPTRNSMMARHPDLYSDCICRVCTEEEEDNEHLWTCPATRETTTTIWKEAMAKIDDWGASATSSYNAAKKRAHERAVASGRQEPPPVPVIWRCPSDEEHARGFASIGGAQSVYQGQPVPDRDLDPKWHVSDLLRGITPKSMLSEWSSVFRSPKSIAQTVLHKFVGYLEAQASELIWKPRCSETIAWEQAQGISAKDKTAKYNGPRGDWSDGYGYITRAGFCPCGASLAAHEDGHCPGPSFDPTAADARLLESHLGRRRLSLMERMGRIPFMRVCE